MRSKEGKARTERPPTAERLRRRALYYLERYATSRSHLRRVLLRRALREAEACGMEAGPVGRMVEETVAAMAAMGLVDDGSFAQMRARRLQAAGKSPRAIRAALQEKGVTGPDIDRAFEALEEEAADPELAAALVYARKRRLGPWRRPEERAALRQRDMGALARAGFGSRVARLILSAEDVDELQAEAVGSVLPQGR
ncbi:RecX family transcriptional regulator [Geminicoccaceae bacterium 1502E]|nr:RecX family transcriptional regulator [Geminicoccaceae bacterium 1502E]